MGKVKQPLVCARRQGGPFVHGNSGLCLKHEERGSEILLNMSRNSIQFEAKIQMVSFVPESGASVKDGEDENLRMQALEGYLSRELQNLEKSPGWHRLPNGVVVFSDAVACSFLDPRQMFGQHWKSRMTLMQFFLGASFDASVRYVRATSLRPFIFGVFESAALF